MPHHFSRLGGEDVAEGNFGIAGQSHVAEGRGVLVVDGGVRDSGEGGVHSSVSIVQSLNSPPEQWLTQTHRDVE